MQENILIAIAWPYANAEIHVGNITGSHLPGDIVARYHRLKGNNVLMVSGTDSHGTPVTLAADKEGIPVEEVYKKYHDIFPGTLQTDLASSMICSPAPTLRTISRWPRPYFMALHQNGFLYHESIDAVVFTRCRKIPSRPVCGRDLLLVRISKVPVPTSVTNAGMCSNRKN